MEREFDWDKLSRYFSGECTAEEEAEIIAWIQADVERQQLIEGLREVWEAGGEPPPGRPSWDATAGWARLSEKLHDKPPVVRQAAPSREPVRRSRNPRTSWLRSSAAQLLTVVVALVVTAAVALLLAPQVGSLFTAPEAPQMREVATEKGQRARIELSDGTHVLLNVDSKITMSSEFTKDVREVTLEGAAYFEVAPDAERPFIVHAGRSVIQVIGTEFAVSAYFDEEDLEVVVAEGKVSLRSEEVPFEEGVLLTERNVGRLSWTGELEVHRNVDLAQHLGWTRGQLVFQDTPLHEVVKQLERWYDLEVQLADSAIASRRLTATFEDEPLSEILNVVTLSLQLQYEREHRSITFSSTTQDR